MNLNLILKIFCVISLLISQTVCVGKLHSAQTLKENRKNRVIYKIFASLDEHMSTKDVPRSVNDYTELITTGTWTEAHPKGNIEVTAEVWTLAIQTALKENQSVFIPYTGRPYYIDAPLVLKSGNRLMIDPQAEIRLKPGTNTCMVRNQHQVSGQNEPVGLSKECDTDIIVDGGIWTTLATSISESNGNLRGGPDIINSLHGHGVILMNSVRQVQIRNLIIKECRPHGVQFSNVTEFMVENIRFVDHRRDGVHVNGPASFGVIRNIRGVTGDDMVALNGWDWKNTSMTFGPIHHILVEKVNAGISGSDFRAEIRFLGGTKNFPDGKTLDCDIEDCVVYDISGIRTFKMYDQPNLELGRDNDFADPIGSFRNLFFSKILIDISSEPTFQVASNVNGMTIDNVILDFEESAPDFKLVQIGPLSMTYKFDPGNPAYWVEVFSPDKDCTVRNLKLQNLQKRQGKDVVSLEPSKYINVITQKPNPGYPNTIPKGGSGKGVLILKR